MVSHGPQAVADAEVARSQAVSPLMAAAAALDDGPAAQDAAGAAPAPAEAVAEAAVLADVEAVQVAPEADGAV